ncbi:hypothetical protein CBR_g19724 [Chara braunii]|uniref:Uncharacterized protein n=1 Tax=Chara braunii TaxID=69332 RepID=A0A388JTS7_CHABU|nr:hypothetical protein CBR_g19724 [Chara braunii]|eukprot:GBG61191.1 hypothetical protein CBR_g19724 [Chara braunii]
MELIFLSTAPYEYHSATKSGQEKGKDDEREEEDDKPEEEHVEGGKDNELEEREQEEEGEDDEHNDLERALGRLKEQICPHRRRTLMQAADDGPDYVATSKAVLHVGLWHHSTGDSGSNAGQGGVWEDLRQCDDTMDGYFNEKQHSAEEQERDHQKQHNDVEQQREPVVLVGHELHSGEGSNAMSVLGHQAHDGGEARVLSDLQHVMKCVGIRCSCRNLFCGRTEGAAGKKCFPDRCRRSSRLGDRMIPAENDDATLEAHRQQ